MREALAWADGDIACGLTLSELAAAGIDQRQLSFGFALERRSPFPARDLVETRAERTYELVTAGA